MGVSSADADHPRTGPQLTARMLARLGLAASALAAFVTCLAVAAATPPLATADETGHVDYAVEIWRGMLPSFYRGVVWRPPQPAVLPPVQWESQHPPLFYALMAPIAGPLADSGHWIATDMAVRFANSVITVLSVLAIAWAAGVLEVGRRNTWRITVAAVAGTIGPVIFVGGSGYGDPLNVLWTALALGIGLIALRRGVTRRLVVAAAAVSAAGALTNALFGIPLFLLLVALAGGLLLHGPGPTLQRLARGAAAGVSVIVAAAASSGWFYLHNKHVSGTFSGAYTQWARVHLGSRHHSLSVVLNSSAFLRTQISLLRHPLDGRAHDIGSTRYSIDDQIGVKLFAVAFILGLIVGLALAVRAAVRRRWPELATYLLLLAALLADLAYEVTYTMGGGGSVSRYLLPATLPIAVILAAGIRAVGSRLAALTLAVYLGLCYAMFCAWLVTTVHPHGKTLSQVPWPLVLAVPVILGVLFVVQVAAVFLLDRRAPTPA